MRILFTRFPYGSVRGGAELQTQWLASGLMARGCAVSLLAQCRVLPAMFTEIGADVRQLDIGLPPVTPWLAASFLWRKNAMKKKLIAAVEALPEKPDVIIMLSLTEKILLTGWAAENGMKVLWIEHDRIGRWLTKNPWLGALKKAAASATVVCVSDLSRRMMTEIGFDPACVVAIPNGIPLPSVSPRKDAGKADQISIGTVARLSPEKGVDVLIHSIVALPEVSLTIVGTGSEEGYLRTLIAEDAGRMGTERIQVVSHVADLDAFYASLDAFVLPSADHDPFGLVAAEAMARGIPVIVTDACGIAGGLRDGHDALVVRAASPEALADGVRRLLDPALRATLASNGRTHAAACFGVDRMVGDYAKLLS